jgi:hypothetical protein
MFPASGDERFAKLPRWARDKFGVYEARIGDLASRLKEYEKGADKSTPISIVGYGEPSVALPDRSTIRFFFGGEWTNYVEVSFEYSDTLRGGAPIGVCVRSGYLLHVEPRASNTIIAANVAATRRASASKGDAQ